MIISSYSVIFVIALLKYFLSGVKLSKSQYFAFKLIYVYAYILFIVNLPTVLSIFLTIFIRILYTLLGILIIFFENNIFFG